MTPIGPPPGVAVDNDVIIKAACYKVTSLFWKADVATTIGILGAARYVVRRRINRERLLQEPEGALAELDALLERAEVLEPDDFELSVAAELEAVAAEGGQELDAGESQLAAIVVKRGMDALETGDKRGIRALEALLDEIAELTALEGRVRCLEQMVARVIVDKSALATMTAAVCAEPEVDKALTICFGCRSRSSTSIEDPAAGLASYIGELRRAAPRLLDPNS